ncbi:MAG: winged helix DNA-binding protein, partial [Alphaproteobacteria bacterium]|nr:winged helix DNA-binding protein [Alphaproteobacteria bacterium]
RPPRTISRRDFLRNGGDDWFREVIYASVEALGRLLACRNAFGRALGLTASQFAVLMGVAFRQASAGVTIRDLARHVALAPTHVTTEVGRLIRRGYLAKRPSPKDRRSVLVSLTGRGERAIAGVAPLVRGTNDVLFQGVAPEDLEIVSRTMRRVTSNSVVALADLRRRERLDHAAD